MRRFDPSSIFAGIVFLGLGVVYLGIGSSEPFVPFPLAVAGVLVCLGVVGIVRIIFRSRRRV